MTCLFSMNISNMLSATGLLAILNSNFYEHIKRVAANLRIHPLEPPGALLVFWESPPRDCVLTISTTWLCSDNLHQAGRAVCCVHTMGPLQSSQSACDEPTFLSASTQRHALQSSLIQRLNSRWHGQYVMAGCSGTSYQHCWLRVIWLYLSFK